MKTLRELIVDSLFEDCKNNRCEWGSTFMGWTEDGKITMPDNLPMQGDWINYPAITREFIESQSDEKLLIMYTDNCCLKFR